ncbi:MAG: hypothetical protein IPJ38_06500 [Dechloromonas sp.]|uniref:Uncharacterized protein n=1 Tax=Candidatus Dechloromonas phosphorivorans TaxID=2899244 RepID=A0A935JX69_9RHOO|nr:hypothetical protein [Candidatus Dechloromonas phosphorivorans]
MEDGSTNAALLVKKETPLLAVADKFFQVLEHANHGVFGVNLHPVIG